MRDDDIFIIDTGTNWFGPYASKEEASEAIHKLRMRGDSLGVKLRGMAVVKKARYTSGGSGIDWDKSMPHSAIHRKRW